MLVYDISLQWIFVVWFKQTIIIKIVCFKRSLCSVTVIQLRGANNCPVRPLPVNSRSKVPPPLPDLDDDEEYAEADALDPPPARLPDRKGMSLPLVPKVNQNRPVPALPASSGLKTRTNPVFSAPDIVRTTFNYSFHSVARRALEITGVVHGAIWILVFFPLYASCYYWVL